MVDFGHHWTLLYFQSGKNPVHRARRYAWCLSYLRPSSTPVLEHPGCRDSTALYSLTSPARYHLMTQQAIVEEGQVMVTRRRVQFRRQRRAAAERSNVDTRCLPPTLAIVLVAARRRVPIASRQRNSLPPHRFPWHPQDMAEAPAQSNDLFLYDSAGGMELGNNIHDSENPRGVFIGHPVIVLNDLNHWPAGTNVPAIAAS